MIVHNDPSHTHSEGILVRTTDGKTVYFSAGDRKLTLRVKLLSQRRGQPVTEEVGLTRYGPKVLGYFCHPDVYRNVKAIIAQEDAKSLAKAQGESDRAMAGRLEASRQLRLALDASLRRRFPLLPEAVRVDCLDRRATAYGPGDPVPTDEYTARQWLRLGCRVRNAATPVGYSVRLQGTALTPLFRPASVSPTASRKAAWDGGRLWDFWRDGFRTDQLALATAVRFANRLVKLAPFAHSRREFYAAKDLFVLHATPYLSEGRTSRREANDCWGCDGTGSVRNEECERCDGSGVFSSRTLHEFLFTIDGEKFSFHSYVPPPAEKLSAEPGADLASYGRRFTATELPRVRLRLAEFTRLIEHAVGRQAVSRP